MIDEAVGFITAVGLSGHVEVACLLVTLKLQDRFGDCVVQCGLGLGRGEGSSTTPTPKQP